MASGGHDIFLGLSTNGPTELVMFSGEAGKVGYPLAMTNIAADIAMENGHRNSGFSHEKTMIFYRYITNYQRVNTINDHYLVS